MQSLFQNRSNTARVFGIRYMSSLDAKSTFNSGKFFQKQKDLGRPMSPHLTIYRPELTSVLSVCHRITGAAWGLSMSAIAVGITIAPHNFEHYIELIKASEFFTPAVLTGGKFFITFPFMYHTVNGIRHLFW